MQLNAQKHTPRKVLLAPLDWGLGHATRCIPLITAFQEQNCEVVLAADGTAAALLRQAFPHLRLLQMKGYRVRYSRIAVLLPFALLRQLPRLLAVIRYEKRWLEALLEKEQFDLIVSDNRPGLWTRKATTVYITHQLQILSGMGAWMDRLLWSLHLRIMHKFDHIWVPDIEGPASMAGILSHPPHYPHKARYIGPISRFKPGTSIPQDIDLLIVLSGPEPQRSMLEASLLKETAAFQGKIVLVQGKENSNIPNLGDNVSVIALADPETLYQLLMRAKLVICRSGYTSLMDLLRLQVKAVLVPTPGQTEQEYLAERMEVLHCFPYITQNEVSLSKAINKASAFSYQFPFTVAMFHEHEAAITTLLQKMAIE